MSIFQASSNPKIQRLSLSSTVGSMHLTLFKFNYAWLYYCRFIGTMQICVARMLQESGIFFCVCTHICLAYWLLTIISAPRLDGNRFLARALCIGCSWWTEQRDIRGWVAFALLPLNANTLYLGCECPCSGITSVSMDAWISALWLC